MENSKFSAILNFSTILNISENLQVKSVSSSKDDSSNATGINGQKSHLLYINPVF
jgi:hypothetical protein